jgi:threonine dehydrogenase-like Zn-dependent dehydrogenase
MIAITIVPGQADSVTLAKVAEPGEDEGSLLVRALQLGVCGTDFDLIAGDYGWAPEACGHLILGHESFGEVQEAPAGSGFNSGDLILGIVRRPDPTPCSACAVGEWDMCRNGRYTERGIKERHGFGSERWRIEPAFALKVEPGLRDIGVLIEPGSVLAKAWEHIEHIGQRAHWRPQTVLVTGAGPIGLLAALMGRQRGLEVHVLDQVTDGPKPKLVEDLGAKYYTGKAGGLGFAPDVVIECTGSASVLRDCLMHLGSGGILCVVGSSAHSQDARLDVGELSRGMVLGNRVAFGVVNAHRRHYEQAAEAIRRGERSWVSGIITRSEPITNWQAAFQREPRDVKVVIDFANPLLPALAGAQIVDMRGVVQAVPRV